MATKKRKSIGIQSIEVGVPLLAAFLRAPEALPLNALAKSARMTPSKAHKYLASFIRAGLVTQDARSGGYRLGPLALELGLMALRQLSAVDVAEGTMLELRDRLALTVSLTVWANQGPTVVRRVETRQLQFITMRVGSVLPLLTSANGRVFLAYLDRHHTQALIDRELGAANGTAARFGLRNLKDVETLIDKIHTERTAEIEGYMSDLVAISAPIFDASNALCAALTIVGVQPANVRNAKPVLLAAVDDLSRQLGANSATQPHAVERRAPLQRTG